MICLPAPCRLGTCSLIFLVAALATSVLHAMPAMPGSAEVTQPDGTTIKLTLHGDEHLHWHEDSNGYPVMRSATSDTWVYATLRDGRFVATTHAVGAVEPRALGITKVERAPLVAAHLQAQGRRELTAAVATVQPQVSISTTGVIKNLVLLVEFADMAGDYPRAYYEALMNEPGYSHDGALGSVRDYYHEVSNQALTIDSVVVDWIKVDNGFAYYGANDAYGYDIRPRQLVAEALTKLNERGFDFTQVDNNGDGWIDGLTVIHAGGAEEYAGNNPNYIWSHKWVLPSVMEFDGVKMFDYNINPGRRGWDSNPATHGITRIGVICHELGHFLGLPDLYDIDYTSRGAGSFCLMAGGGWNGQLGNQPAHMSAWCKLRVNWIEPEPITGPGTFTISDVVNSQQIYSLKGGLGGLEYFLIENRHGAGFDASLPGIQRGLLIWHIDDSQTSNRNEDRYWVDLEEASGPQHLQSNINNGDDGDYWRAGNATTFSKDTTPNSQGYDGSLVGLQITSVSAAGSTMTFAVAPDISVDHFAITQVAARQEVGEPFTVTVQARDAQENRIRDYDISPDDPEMPSLTLRQRATSTLGTATASWEQPLDTLWHDSRTQVLYRASEVGPAGTLTGLALQVERLPGQSMSNWTIRLKHTSRTEYGANADWDRGGWTTVHRSTATISSTDWVWFHFSTPFSFNGTSNLLVDMSFNNSSYTRSGVVASLAAGTYRTLHHSVDSTAGDPLDWGNGSGPAPRVTNRLPLIRLERSAFINRTLAAGNGFVNGVWVASVTPLAAATGVVAHVSDIGGSIGVSNTFAVTATPAATISGNGQVIANGDPSPSLDKATDFGVVEFDGGSFSTIYNIRNVGTGTLQLSGNPRVVISGTNAGDFTVTSQPPATIEPQATATFTIRFAPSAAGLRQATVSLAMNTETSPYTFAIRGTGDTAANATPALALTVSPSSILRGDGVGASLATLTRTIDSGAVTVALASSETSEVTVPPRVQFNDGELQTTFSIDVSAGNQASGTVGVVITATAIGYQPASAVVTISSENSTSTVIYTHSVRGSRHGNGGGPVIGNGYLVVDLQRGQVVSLVKYGDGSSERTDWHQQGLWYTADAGAGSYWFMTTEPNYGQSGTTPVNTYDYRHLFGPVHPSRVHLGGTSEGFVSSNLNGQRRSGTTGTVMLGELQSRLQLPFTRIANNAGMTFEDVLSVLSSNLGIAPPPSPQPAEPLVTTAAANAIVCYTLSMRALEAGSGTVNTTAYGGYLLIDYATREVRAILTRGTAFATSYTTTKLSGGAPIDQVLPLGNGYQILGGIEADLNHRSFWFAHGALKTHPLGTGSDQRVPFAIRGERWRFTQTPAGRFAQSPFSAAIHPVTLQLNQQNLNMESALTYVIDTLLPNASELAPRP